MEKGKKAVGKKAGGRVQRAPVVKVPVVKVSGDNGIKKQYLKSKAACRVTFRLPKEASAGARNVMVVGEFNDWDRDAAPMKKLGSGDFTATLELQAGKDYRFRYLVDGAHWENDWHADRYEPSPYGGDNSVVVV